jgi:hypothetical protein
LRLDFQIIDGLMGVFACVGWTPLRHKHSTSPSHFPLSLKVCLIGILVRFLLQSLTKSFGCNRCNELVRPYFSAINFKQFRHFVSSGYSQ